jgi:putative transposase
MKKKRFTEEQIIVALKEHESGSKVVDLCRRMVLTAPIELRRMPG